MVKSNKPTNSLQRGDPFIWVGGAALALILLAVVLLLGVVVANGAGAFWPAKLTQLDLRDGSRVLGEVTRRQAATPHSAERLQIRVGNRDMYGADFRWIDAKEIKAESFPAAAVQIERQEYGPFIGFLNAGDRLRTGARPPHLGNTLSWQELGRELEQVKRDARPAAALQKTMNGISRRAESARLEMQRLMYRGVAESAPEYVAALAAREHYMKECSLLSEQKAKLLTELRKQVVVLEDAGGKVKELPLPDVVRACQPNSMTVTAKVGFYLEKLWELLASEPREANTEGGLLPAIIGTVMMVFLMSIFAFPLGVMTAVYLREYAKDGWMVRGVRIAVNNLAGIPSIVYGIFGLGFFVYGVGAGIDQLFFPERLPTPTWGTGGILWESLTLSLLTVPVVIVATEEALCAIPPGVRQASLALGATPLQTLMRVLLPMASPGILTGFILAMARAAGEVAPLMMTGVVKLAPSLPLDGTFPFVHLDCKFMHLGFHIYDVGFQSPNVEAARPMVFMTTLLLLVIVLLLSGTAIWLRNRMRKRYAGGAF